MVYTSFTYTYIFPIKNQPCHVDFFFNTGCNPTHPMTMATCLISYHHRDVFLSSSRFARSSNWPASWRSLEPLNENKREFDGWADRFSPGRDRYNNWRYKWGPY